METTRFLAVSALVVVMTACGSDATAPPDPPAAATPPVPVTPPATVTPPPPAHDARLAVLGNDGTLRVLDAHDLTAAPTLTLTAPDTEVILGAREDGAFLLGDHFMDVGRRVLLVTALETKELTGTAGWGAFEPTGEVVTAGERTTPSCGSVTRDPFLLLHPRDGGDPRTVAGDRLGWSEDGRAWVMEIPAHGACAPAGGRRLPGPSRLERFDPVTGVTSVVEGDAVTIGVVAGGRVVATLALTGFGFGGPTCTLHVAGTSEPLTECAVGALVVSPDGRYLARSIPADEHPDLVVVDTTDGAHVATHAGHRPPSTIGLSAPSVGATFSPDGTALVVAHPDGDLVLTTPDGRDPRSLGYGNCAGFSPDGRFVLVTTYAPRITVRVVDTTTLEAQYVEDVWDAVFLPPAG